MSTSDHDLPIAESFHGLVQATQSTDLSQEEARLKSEKEARMALFSRQHPGALTVSQAFLPEERENERLKSTIVKELDAQASIKPQEKTDAKSTDGEFPPPPILP